MHQDPVAVRLFQKISTARNAYLWLNWSQHCTNIELVGLKHHTRVYWGRSIHIHTNTNVNWIELTSNSCWTEMPRIIRLRTPATVCSKQGIVALSTVQLHNDGLNYLNYGACMNDWRTRVDVFTQVGWKSTSSLQILTNQNRDMWVNK